MNNRNIEKSIAKAVNQAPTMNLEDLAKVQITKMTENDYITMQPKIKTTNHSRQFFAALTCCFAMLCFSGWFIQYRVPDSIITIEVNPSIEIVTNRQNHILSVNALNEDAQKVIDSVNDKSSDLNSIVDALIASIINHEYLNVDKNVVIISVENKNIKKADTLVLSLNHVIQDSALSHKITPQVLKQVFTKDKDASALAAQYNLSVGKLKLIQKIISSSAKFSIETLASKSMEDLIAISKENGIDLQKIFQ